MMSVQVDSRVFGIQLRRAGAEARHLGGGCNQKTCVEPVRFEASWYRPHRFMFRPPSLERMLLCDVHARDFSKAHEVDIPEIAA